MESLPLVQDDEEYAILEKFVGALARFDGRDISGPYRKGDPWPDFEKGAGASSLGIELTTVTYQPHARLQRLQGRYAQRVRELLSDALPLVSGLRLQLEDGDQVPEYPWPRSPRGEAVAKAIADMIRADAARLRDLPVWTDASSPPPMRVNRAAGPDGVTIGYVAHRFATMDLGAEPVVTFFGSFPMRSEVHDSILWQAIDAKVKKHYTHRYPGHLWLLVYGQASLVAGADSAVAYARERLAQASHPFAEVWFIGPYPGQMSGSIERIWPGTSARSPTRLLHRGSGLIGCPWLDTTTSRT